MLPVEGQMLPDLTSNMQTDYTQLGIKPASTMLIHWCSRKDLNQQWVYAKSELGFRWLWHFWSSRIAKGRFTILPNHGIKATGTCPLLVPAWSDQVAKSTYVHDFPRTLLCWRTVTKTPKQNFCLSLVKIDHYLCQHLAKLWEAGVVPLGGLQPLPMSRLRE